MRNSGSLVTAGKLNDAADEIERLEHYIKDLRAHMLVQIEAGLIERNRLDKLEAKMRADGNVFLSGDPTLREAIDNLP